jgi:sulfur transfer complex TusBCD TusB component (DsrH family)
MSTKTEKILKTKDYSLFQVFKFNRPVNEGLVKRIMESIKEIGYMEGKPVLVDEEMAIIDGQHRFTACERLGIEVPYVMTSVDPQKEIIHLNANQVHWKMADYVHTWAEQGVKCYVHLEDFEARRKFGITNSILILFGGSTDKTDIKRIKAGYKFTINPKAETIAAFINSCGDVPYAKSSYFIKAVVRLFKVANEAQIAKIKAGIISLPQQPTAAAYLAAFENIANRNVRANNRVSFKAGH